MSAPATPTSAKQGPPRRHRLHSKPAKLDAVRNEINVTPLVDVCLVLLIIFMVVTPMLTRGKEVELPQTRHHVPEGDKQQPIVAVDSRGQIWVGQDPVPDLATMKQRITEEWNTAGPEAQQLVYVKADREVQYGKVYPVVLALHEMGLSRIDLGTNEIKDEDE
jgi:biopolymer transport protein ExbD